MNICYIGKYPPIEGGVSVQAYWSLHGLAQQGARITVVSNAAEVETIFRMRCIGPDDACLEKQYPASGGYVRLRYPEVFSPHRMSHIPLSSMFVSRLASVAADVCSSEEIDLILASYFEPYGVAASLVSSWTGIPFAVKHAGSDLDRLMSIPDLSRTYREMLLRSSLLLTQPSLLPRFLRMGLAAANISTTVGFSLPEDIFNAEASSGGDLAHLRQYLETKDQVEQFDRLEGLPVIGVYGKLGETKGTFDLIAALGRLRKQGKHFHLVAAVGGYSSVEFHSALRSHDLAACTTVFPFLPHWRIPTLIKKCTAVCFLERDFPVAIHGPIVPREVFMCGVCLLLSREIADKQYYRSYLSDGTNVLVVESPKDHDELAEKLDLVISQPSLAKTIGHAGAQIPLARQTFNEFASSLSHTLQSVVDRGRSGRTSNDEAKESSTLFMTWFPISCELLARCGCDLPIMGQTMSSSSTSTVIKDLYTELTSAFANANTALQAPYALDIARYEWALASLCEISACAGTSGFTAQNSRSKTNVSYDLHKSLIPVLTSFHSVQLFDYDLPSLVRDLERGGTGVPTASPRLSTLLIARSPNFRFITLRVSPLVSEAIGLMNGDRSVEDIVTSIARLSGQKEPGEELKQNICRFLDLLYSKSVLIYTNGGGA